MPDRLLSVIEVAERLSRSRVTIYRMIHAGELPAVQFRGGIRVRESDLEEYIEALPAVLS